MHFFFFRPFLIANMAHMSACLEFTVDFMCSHLISLNSFMAVPDLVRILYKSFLPSEWKPSLNPINTCCSASQYALYFLQYLMHSICHYLIHYV